MPQQVAFHVWNLNTVSMGSAYQQMFNQPRNILLTLAQWRNRYAGHRDPIKQVTPKPLMGHIFAQITVCCRDQPKVDFAWLCLAQPVYLPLFQHPKKITLQLQGHFADFIQKQCAPVCGFNLAFHASTASPGERPVRITEQFAGEQVLGKTPTVNGDKRPVFANT